MFTQHSLVAGYQHFETAFQSHLQGSSSPRRIPETGDDVGSDWFLGKIKEPNWLLEQATFVKLRLINYLCRYRMSHS